MQNRWVSSGGESEGDSSLANNNNSRLDAKLIPTISPFSLPGGEAAYSSNLLLAINEHWVYKPRGAHEEQDHSGKLWHIVAIGVTQFMRCKFAYFQITFPIVLQAAAAVK